MDARKWYVCTSSMYGQVPWLVVWMGDVWMYLRPGVPPKPPARSLLKCPVYEVCIYLGSYFIVGSRAVIIACDV